MRFFKKTKLNLDTKSLLIYAIFILSISGYFYWSKLLMFDLLRVNNSDPYIWWILGSLAAIWVGSAILIGLRLRFYMGYKAYGRAAIVSLSPIVIIPLIWLVFEGLVLISA